MTAILALGCLAVGFIAGLLLRTGYVMTQISWSQERMERRVRYWQIEAFQAQADAEDARRQLAAVAGSNPQPADWPGPGTDWR